MNSNTSNRLKNQLMLQSLSPLALLTIIRNWEFTYPTTDSYSFYDVWALNEVLIVVMLVCTGWVVCAAASYIYFLAFRWSAGVGGYQVTEVKELEDASLNFFMTLIIPLLIDNVGSISGALTFAIIVILMCVLLSRTSLFYANPVLAILGYRVYEFKFVDNKDEPSGTCIGIVRGKIDGISNTFEYKKITEKVFLIKEVG